MKKWIIFILLKVAEFGIVGTALYWLGIYSVSIGFYTSPPYKFLYLVCGTAFLFCILGGLIIIGCLGYSVYQLIKLNLKWADKLSNKEE